MNLHALVGTCTWDACKKCYFYRKNEGCTYYNLTFVVKDGDVFCMEFGEVKE